MRWLEPRRRGAARSNPGFRHAPEFTDSPRHLPASRAVAAQAHGPRHTALVTPIGAPMSDSGNISVLGICGSLRRGSYNMATLRAAIALKPANMNVTVADISQIPPYNEDVREQGFPAPVETLRRQIAAADALLF